jgi:tRNA(Ile)-lysidine synthase
MFLEALKQAVKQNCGLTHDFPVLVGVSGGADSLALMHGLDALGFNLRIAHIDHALRPESAQDADYVQHLAESRGLPFVRERFDIQKIAETAGQSLEEAARHVRYQFLFQQARDHGVQAVAVGHHADDQVETVLMHFLRGSALSGLSGMSYRRVMPIWDPEIPLVRPLLGIWRDEIEVYLAEVGLEPRVDLSNKDSSYFRNRIRHKLIPELQTYNPQIREVLWRMTIVLHEEDRFLVSLAEDAWVACLFLHDQERIELNHTAFLRLSKAIQRRVLRKAISLLRPDLRDVGFDAIERALAFAEKPSRSKKIDLVARLNMMVIDDLLIVKTWAADLPDWRKPLLVSKDHQATLGVEMPVELRHGWQVSVSLINQVPDDIFRIIRESDKHQAWLDYDRLALPLTVRGRNPGDYWQPLGMEAHTQKLQDFFINEKVPEHLRDFWPLVCSGEDIVWVAGLRPSEAVKITPDTRNILHLRLHQ